MRHGISRVSSFLTYNSMRQQLLLFLLLTLLVCGCPEVKAAEIEYSFAGGEISGFGTGKKEIYDVAIRLKGSSFIGKHITGVSVPVSASVKNPQVWLSEELGLGLVEGKEVNIPDILSVPVDIVDNEIKITFNEPYVIGPDGVFIGYSFELASVSAEVDKKPVAIDKNTSDEDGLWIHSSRTYKAWENISLTEGMVSAISVRLEGEFDEFSVGIEEVVKVRALAGEPFVLPVRIVNNGLSEVSDLMFACEINGATEEVHLTLDTPLSAVFNSKKIVNLEMPPLGKGVYDVVATIKEVKGHSNNSPVPSSAGIVRIVSEIPVKRVLMEEYTGSWCGYCVKGCAAMQHLASKYPDEFIGVAFHKGDPMSVTGAFPISISSLPVCSIDRVWNTDPYSGTQREGFGIEDDVLARMALESPACIDIHASWQGDDLVATSYVTFVEEPYGNYEIVYLLLEDGMHGGDADWAQTNYYSGKDSAEFIPEMKQFCDGAPLMEDFHFNDVVVMCSDLYGEPNSVVNPKVDEVSVNSYIFTSVKDAKNLGGESVVQDLNRLKVVGVLLDKSTGVVINSAITSASGAGANMAETGHEIIKREYYAISGHRIESPVSGLNVEIISYDDGKIEVHKLFIP